MGVAERRRTRGILVAGVAVALLPLGGGCSGGPHMSTSTTEATVTGKVSVAGKPVSDGDVVFNPANAKRKFVPIRRVPVGKDGTYSVTTLVGYNAVSFDPPAVKGKKDARLSNQIFSFDVKSGENTFDLELKPEAP